MVRTASTMMPLGSPAPDFSLTNVDGRTMSLADFAGKPGMLVVFMCNHCPFVIHLQTHFVATAQEYMQKGLAVVAISSNDVVQYPQDGPDAMRQRHAEAGFTFPYLFDATQSAAQAYRAACTPDFFLFDSDHRLVYRGQYDDSRPKTTIPVSGHDLRAACDALLAGQPIVADQKPSIGCNIKWKVGGEPDYFSGLATG